MHQNQLMLLALALSLLSACAANGSAPAVITASPSATSAVVDREASLVELEKTIIDLEKKAWELAKTKQFEEYRQLFAPGFRAVYSDGIQDGEAQIKYINSISIKSYAFSELKLDFPAKNMAVITYREDGVVISSQGKELKDPLYCSAVWVNSGGAWKCALYTETTVAPAK